MDSELLNLVLLNIFGRTNNSTVSVPAAIFFLIVKKQQQLIQRASEASEADSQSCSIEISDIYNNRVNTGKNELMSN